MGNWDFIMGGEHRLKAWKNLRSELTEPLTPTDYLEKVTKFWSLAPLQNPVLDPDNHTAWPDPWQLLYNGDFDTSAVSLGMLYTLSLAEKPIYNEGNMNLLLLKNSKEHKLQLAVCVDNHALLGWEYNTVVDWNEVKPHCTVQRKYVYDTDANTVLNA